MNPDQNNKVKSAYHHDVEYQEGQNAAIDQIKGLLPIAVNPYNEGSPEFNRWCSGYLDAKEEG